MSTPFANAPLRRKASAEEGGLPGVAAPRAPSAGPPAPRATSGLALAGRPPRPTTAGTALGRVASRRLSSIVLDDQFDTLLPLSPSLDQVRAGWALLQLLP